MGNQGYSTKGARECCEIIWNNEIGNVSKVLAWTDRPGKYWPQGPGVEPTPGPVPATLDWDVWLGGAEPQPFSPGYIPISWRGYPQFGCGAIGDMACHILGTPNMAMRLGAPSSVECIKLEGKNKYTFPLRTVIRFDFPARPGMPPVQIFWHDRLSAPPKVDGLPDGTLIGDKDTNGSLFIGDKGMVTTGCYGEDTRLVPDDRMKDYKLPPQLLTRSPGHYRDWIRACKGGDPSCSNFGVAGPFVQWMLLGVIAMNFEGKLEWDANKHCFSNNKAANENQGAWLNPASPPPAGEASLDPRPPPPDFCCSNPRRSSAHKPTPRSRSASSARVGAGSGSAISSSNTPARASWPWQMCFRIAWRRPGRSSRWRPSAATAASAPIAN
jgi:hypothetical protein